MDTRKRVWQEVPRSLGLRGRQSRVLPRHAACDVIKCLLLLLPCHCMHRMLEKSGGAHTEPALLRLLHLHSDPSK